MSPRVRFAPSPTGSLHLGGARTALFNYLYAKKFAGKFFLRIEDTDKKRSKTKYIDQICDSLKWLGIDWDDNILFQSEREIEYKNLIDNLIDSGAAYRCFATNEEIEKVRKVNSSWQYPGIWRDKEKNDIKREIEKGSKFTVRLKTPLSGKTEFFDLIYGKITVQNEEIDDFIIARSDGSPVYNITNVIDDNEMGITHVIRGEDHVTNTIKQILIYYAFGWSIPIYAHLPMILGEDKKRLSKRHEATGVDSYKFDGYMSDAIVNYLALLGWNPGNDEEIMSKHRLIESFDIAKVQKKSAVFDLRKLNWICSQHLSTKNSKDLLKMIKDIEPNWGENSNNDYCISVIDLMKIRSNSLKNIITMTKYFFKLPKNIDKSDLIKIKREDSIELISALRLSLMEIKNWISINIEDEFKKFIKVNGIGFAKIMKPSRLAICGRLDGPSLFDIIEIIGKESTLIRLEKAESIFQSE